MKHIFLRILAWRQRTRQAYWAKLASKIGGVSDFGPVSIFIHAKGLTLLWRQRTLWRGEISDPPENY